MQAYELVVLAAGASTRMGHPKALTSIDGEPALARIARAAGGAIASTSQNLTATGAADPSRSRATSRRAT